MDEATILFLSFINLTTTNTHIYVNIFSGMVGYCGPDILYHCTVAVVIVAPPFVMTAYSFPQIIIIVLLSRYACWVFVLYLQLFML